MSENQFNTKIKMVRSANETEIMRKERERIFHSKGIIQKSIPGVPQQSARVERKNRYVLEIARSLRIHVGFPKFLWRECILATIYLINLLSRVVIGWKTPYERLMKKEPTYEHLRIIGCPCYASSSEKKGDKFKGKEIICVLVGYPYRQKGYKVYDLQNKRIFISSDVMFKENIFPFILIQHEDNSLKIVMNEVPLVQGEERVQI